MILENLIYRSSKFNDGKEKNEEKTKAFSILVQTYKQVSIFLSRKYNLLTSTSRYLQVSAVEKGFYLFKQTLLLLTYHSNT